SPFPRHAFFFQAEDGIRDFHVTGVQTCALPIYYVQYARSSAIRLGEPPVLTVDMARGDAVDQLRSRRDDAHGKPRKLVEKMERLDRKSVVQGQGGGRRGRRIADIAPRRARHTRP